MLRICTKCEIQAGAKKDDDNEKKHSQTLSRAFATTTPHHIGKISQHIPRYPSRYPSMDDFFRH